MDDRIGKHGEQKPSLTVSGATLQIGVLYSKRGIGNDNYVYLDIGQGNQDDAVEAVKQLLASKTKVAKKAKPNESS